MLRLKHIIGNIIREVPGAEIISPTKVSARTPKTLANGLCDSLEYVVLR